MCYIEEATDMLVDLYEMIWQHERKGDFTHTVVTDEMLSEGGKN